MKKVSFFGKSLAIGALTLLVSACSGDDSPSGTGTGGHSGSYITATVDGAGFDAAIMGVPVVTAVRTGAGDNNLIMITGSDSNGHSISINLFGVTQNGTYQVNPDTNSVLAYVDGMGNSTRSYDTGECAGATGSVNVTFVDDTKVEGTFQFTGKSEENGCAAKAVTSGSFRGIYLDN